MNNNNIHATIHSIQNKHIYIFDKYSKKPFEIQLDTKYNYFWGVKVSQIMFKKIKIGDLLLLKQKQTSLYLKVFDKTNNQKYNWIFIKPDIEQRSSRNNE